jgi:aconitase A
LKPQQDVTLVIKRKDGSKQEVTVLLRIDTPIEVDYYRTAAFCRSCCERFSAERMRSSAAA